MKRFVLWILLFIFGNAFAQEAPKVDGTFGEPPNEGFSESVEAPQVRPQTVNVGETEDRNDYSQGPELPGRPIIGGYVLPARDNLLSGLKWTNVAKLGKVLRVELYSKGGRAMRISIANPNKTQPLRFNFYAPSGGRVHGPYSVGNMVTTDSKWWSPMIFGDRLGVEIIWPQDRSHEGKGGTESESKPELKVTDIAYIYWVPKNINNTDELGCHNDISCFPSWKNSEGRSVTMLSSIIGGNVVGFCSGSSLYRSPGDVWPFSPLVYTASHCISTQGEANSTTFVWYFETATCNGTPPNPNTLPQNTGSLMLKLYTPSDNVLLGCYDQPASDFYNGWDANYWSNLDPATGVHHPDATFKRISFGLKIGESTRTFQGGATYSIWDIQFSSGITEPGSSGSPIYDSARRVRGALTGGFWACTDDPPKYYGRLDLAYSTLQPYIFNMANPTYALAGWGGAETGSSGSPFNTVFEASFCVPTGAQINIFAGNYPENIRLWRPMKLTTAGGNVRIGN